MCCHPALSPASQIALTLRAVGGLTTAEIARAFLVPEATMTRRISRAKQRIKDSGVPFAMPPGGERGQRLGAVLHVLYLIFNEGYASTSGPSLHRSELSAEAIRLARMVHRLLPDDGEVTGLLALMLLTDARRPARTGPDGGLVPMAEQDRSLWDAGEIAEGVALITEALPRGPTGPYQLQAAIAAVHDEAPSAEATDWPQIVALYELLLRISDNPVVALNHAVAVAMAAARTPGSTCSAKLEADERIAERPPAPRGPRAPAGAGRRPRRSPRRLPGGGPADDQPAPAALPPRPGGPPGREQGREAARGSRRGNRSRAAASRSARAAQAAPWGWTSISRSSSSRMCRTSSSQLSGRAAATRSAHSTNTTASAERTSSRPRSSSSRGPLRR